MEELKVNKLKQIRKAKTEKIKKEKVKKKTKYTGVIFCIAKFNRGSSIYFASLRRCNYYDLFKVQFQGIL